MENDKYTATASNMKNDDVENASAWNIDEDTNNAKKKMVWIFEHGFFESNHEETKEWEARRFWQELIGLKESPPHEDRPADECCICGVPNSLRDSNPEAYTPQLISIGPFHHKRAPEAYTQLISKGPYHHKSAGLMAMETLKRMFQKQFLESNKIDEKKFMDFVRRIQEEEESIRRCYSERFFINTEDFVKMIVLDAVFIIEFLKESCTHHFPRNIDARMRFCIGEDLMLLENQLPFSILDKIYSEFYQPAIQDENETPLLVLATRHFGKYPLAQGPESICTTDKAQHFTDLLMKSMLKVLEYRRKNILE